MIRLFSETPLSSGAHVALEESQAHYVNSVMRLKIGDPLLIFDGTNGEWRARIIEGKKKKCVIEVIELTRAQCGVPDLWLAFAPIKKQRLDYIIEKATEIGAATLLPVLTQNTITSTVRMDRLRIQAIEAAEQSERLCIPTVQEPQSLKDFVANWPAQRKLFVLDERKSAIPVGEALLNELENTNFIGSCGFLVGPEGGFDPSELDLLDKLPFVVRINVGPRILRADTACIAALTVWQALLGDWKDPLRQRFE